MTKDEFLTSYAEALGSTPEKLKERGYTAKACGCEQPECTGWIITDENEIEVEP